MINEREKIGSIILFSPNYARQTSSLSIYVYHCHGIHCLRIKIHWKAGMSSFVTANMLLDRQLRNRGLIPVRDKRFLYFLKWPDRPWGSPNILLDARSTFLWRKCVKHVKVTVHLHIVTRVTTDLLDKSIVEKLIALELTDWIATYLSVPEMNETVFMIILCNVAGLVGWSVSKK